MYRIFIFLYPLFVRGAALWNPKARRWVAGREGLIQDLQNRFREEKRPVAWFHCASLGEFEQGRPVMERFKAEYPGVFLLLTFFSPSGLEVSKSYPDADFICYLPMDSPAHARQFLDAVKPSMAVFIKYEFWHFYLAELKSRKIPTLLVSAVFRADQPFFRWYGGFWRNMLAAYSCIFVQDEASLTLLQGIGFKGPTVLVSGDTRFDRVLAIAEKNGGIPEVAAFANSAPVIVAGSTWNEDEKELVHFAKANPKLRFVIAPHEISPDHLQYLRKYFPGVVFFSEWAKIFKDGSSMPESAQCLVIDNVGMLSRLYKYATITYVGGGFGGDGVHNVLEPAVWGKPVVFGPIYDKYREASDLIETGGGFTAENTLELEKCFRSLLEQPAALDTAGKAARAYVLQQAGATTRILAYIQANRLFTK